MVEALTEQQGTERKALLPQRTRRTRLLRTSSRLSIGTSSFSTVFGALKAVKYYCSTLNLFIAS